MLKTTILGIAIIIFSTLQGCWWMYLLLKESDLSKVMILSEGITFVSIMGILGFLFITFFRKEIKNLNLRAFILQAAAHELRSPLTAIKLALENISKPERATRAKQIMEEEILRIDEFLSHSLEAIRSTSLQPESFELDSFISSWSKNKPDVKLNLQKKIVRFPKKILLITLEELYHNAKKAGATEFEISDYAQGLKFSDNGKGIDARYLDKIFNENFSTTDSSGLGLYIVQSILKKYNLKFSVSHQVNPTTFKVEGLN